MTKIKKFFGDRDFYKKVLAISVPIMVQNGITQMVNLLDNIMVGSLGTEAISGVSIVNEFISIFNIVIFGAGAASGIFTAQYHGAGDTKGVRYTFRMKFLVNMIISAIAIVLLSLFNEPAISLFLQAGDAASSIAQTMAYSKEYLVIILVGLVPYGLSQAYASTLRETREVMLPTVSSVIAMVTNFVLNFILIFGHLGLPAMGVAGAALATTISRFVEVIFLLICTHAKSDKYAFIKGAYASLKIPINIVRQIIIKGFPLMINEVFWSTAITFRNQCISMTGLESVAALNIQATVYRTMTIAYTAQANAISIIVGNMLGAGEIEEAKDSNRKLVTLSFLVGVFMTGVACVAAPILPKFYNISDSVRSLATYMVIVSGLSMPFGAITLSCYFTLRSGGLTMLTMLFDCGYAWVATLPVAYILAYHTNVGIHILFAAVIFTDALKSLLGLFLINKVKWARKLT